MLQLQQDKILKNVIVDVSDREGKEVL